MSDADVALKNHMGTVGRSIHPGTVWEGSEGDSIHAEGRNAVTVTNSVEDSIVDKGNTADAT